MADIKLEHISKSYPPDVKAVDDVNLHIRDGEFMICSGPPVAASRPRCA